METRKSKIVTSFDKGPKIDIRNSKHENYDEIHFSIFQFRISRAGSG
jgi:hypothetical protein